MISEEAVDAAVAAYREHRAVLTPAPEGEYGSSLSYTTPEELIPIILEAAAPHLFAQLLALADERDETPGAIRGHITTYELRQALNPYRSQA